MEHRVGQRVPVRLDVRLSCRRSPELEGEIRDLSARGAFIRVKGDYSTLRNIVHLRFRVPAANPEEFCECWAMIIRNEADGIGVMFDHLQEAAFAKLKAPVSPPKSERSRTTPETLKLTDRTLQQESVTQ